MTSVVLEMRVAQFSNPDMHSFKLEDILIQNFCLGPFPFFC